MSLQMICLISEPANECCKIILNKNPLCPQLLPSMDYTHPSGTKLCSQDGRLKKMRAPHNQEIGIRIMDGIAHTIPVIINIAIKINLDKPRRRVLPRDEKNLLSRCR